jgi:hypothetical protein
MDGNGKKVKHREEKIIEFFSSDVSGFNFGVPPTPTPTFTPSVTPTPRPPYDEFYNKKVSTVLYQYNQWEAELGKLEANQRIIKWLNGQLPGSPPIPDEISGATSIGNPYDIWVEFKDGKTVCISTLDPIRVEDYNTDERLPEKEEIKPLTHLTAASSNNNTVKNADIIMISPYLWEVNGALRVEEHLCKYLRGNGYEVTCINTNMDVKAHNDETPVPDDIYLDWDHPVPPEQILTPIPNPNKPLINCYIASTGNWDNILSPDVFETIGKYGIIYIQTHGGPIGEDPAKFNADYPGTSLFRLSCTVDVLDRDKNTRTKLETWTDKHSSEEGHTKWWFYRYREINLPLKPTAWVRELALTNKFFDSINANQNFEGSLIYWCGCCSWHMRHSFTRAKVYVGYDRFSNSQWAFPFAYDFFWFMMNGTKNCRNIKPQEGNRLDMLNAPTPSGTPSFDEDKPMDATEALNTLGDYYKVNPDPGIYHPTPTPFVGPPPPPTPPIVDTTGCTAYKYQKDPNEHVYFPVPVVVTVHKK